MANSMRGTSVGQGKMESGATIPVGMSTRAATSEMAMLRQRCPAVIDFLVRSLRQYFSDATRAHMIRGMLDCRLFPRHCCRSVLVCDSQDVLKPYVSLQAKPGPLPDVSFIDVDSTRPAVECDQDEYEWSQLYPHGVAFSMSAYYHRR